MNVAVYPSGHGLGHVVRCMEVARTLHELEPELGIHLRGPFDSEWVRNSLGFVPASIENRRYDIGLVQIDSLRHDHEASLLALGEFFARGEKLIREEARWLREQRIDAALIDIPPHPFAAATRAGVPAYGLGNFTWSAVWGDLSDEGFKPFAEQARAWYAEAELFYAAQMEFGLEVFPRIIQVPLIGRRSRKEPGEIREKLGLDSDPRPILLLTFGGEGLSEEFTLDPSIQERFLVVTTPPMSPDIPGVHFITEAQLVELDLNYSDLMRVSEVALLKPGYSTIAECAANEAGMIIVPREGFVEADVLLRWSEAHLPCAKLPREQFLRGEWSSAFDRLSACAIQGFDAVEVNGAEVIARDLLKRLHSH